MGLELADFCYDRRHFALVRTDTVGDGSVDVYAENAVNWTSWLKTIVGWRGNYSLIPTTPGTSTPPSEVQNSGWWWRRLAGRNSSSVPVQGERQRMQRAEPADKVEQKLAVGLGKGQISEFVQNDEVHPSEMLGKPVRPV